MSSRLGQMGIPCKKREKTEIAVSKADGGGWAPHLGGIQGR